MAAVSELPAPGTPPDIPLDRAGLLGDARAAYDAGRLADAAASALRASALATQRGDSESVIRAALLWTGVPDPRMAATVEHLVRSALSVVDPQDRARAGRLRGQLAVALHLLERLDAAAAEARIATELAQGSPDPLTTVAALHARQLAIAGLGSGPELAELGNRMLVAAAGSGDADAELLARSCRIEGLLRVGDTAQAGHEIAALDVLATRTGLPLVHWNARLARAGLEHAFGQFTAAEAHARDARIALPEVQRPHTEPLFIAQLLLVATDLAVEPPEIELARGVTVGAPPIAIAMTGRYELEVGDLGRARAAFEAVRPRLDGVALDRRGLPTLTAAIELAVALGDAEVASAIGERLAPFDGAMIVSALGAVGPVAHFLGLVDGLQGEHERAVAHAESAARLAASGGFAPWAARARLALAVSLLARNGSGHGDGGARVAAARMANVARLAAGQLGMRSLAARATAFEDGLSSRGRLSTRELEIAALVASGASNREIAKALVVSERTVETHVQHVLDKLGFRSRVQVAGWAVEVGLPQRSIR